MNLAERIANYLKERGDRKEEGKLPEEKRKLKGEIDNLLDAYISALKSTQEFRKALAERYVRSVRLGASSKELEELERQQSRSDFPQYITNLYFARRTYKDSVGLLKGAFNDPYTPIGFSIGDNSYQVTLALKHDSKYRPEFRFSRTDAQEHTAISEFGHLSIGGELDPFAAHFTHSKEEEMTSAFELPAVPMIRESLEEFRVQASSPVAISH